MMVCDICKRVVEETIPFYYGFFKAEYEPEKWVQACPDCCRRFQRASNGYNYNKMPLIEMKQQIINNVEKKNVRVRK